VPELPEVETVRRELEPVMREARIDRVLLRRPDLRTRFPRRFIARLEGTTVRAVNRRAKYLLVPVSSGETLVMHLGMSGSFRVEIKAINAIDAVDGDDAMDAAPLTATFDRHDHVIFSLSTGARIVFNDPRRFGFMDLVRDADMLAHPTLGGLGPEPLSDAFDGDALARACAGRKTSLKVALLDQRVVAGLGNIYASEALYVAGLSPSRRASTIATPGGAPREPAHRLAAAIKLVLEQAIERATGVRYRGARFRVYDRDGIRCQRRGCSGIVRRRTQAGRSTFYCRVCQR
jgi:formamidopyrimidine-DNA glycosylase